LEGVALGCFMLISVLRPAEFHWHAMSLAIMLVVVYLYIPNRLLYASSIAAVTTVVFIFLAHRYSRLTPADAFTMGMLLVLVNTFGFLAACRFQHVSREEFRSWSVLKHAAERAHLTGCFNRRYLHDHLMGGQWVDRAPRGEQPERGAVRHRPLPAHQRQPRPWRRRHGAARLCAHPAGGDPGRRGQRGAVWRRGPGRPTKDKKGLRASSA
jgi:hypothetical protein